MWFNRENSGTAEGMTADRGVVISGTETGHKAQPL